jgi:hypothetical protein
VGGVGSRLLAHYQALRPDTSHQERTENLAALRTEAGVLLEDVGIEEPILAWGWKRRSSSGSALQ